DDGCWNPKQLSVVSQAERVISGARRDNASLFLLAGQQQQSIAGTAFLKAAGALQVFQLAENLHAGEVRKRNRAGTRRFEHGAGNAAGGSLDVVEVTGSAV